MSRRCQERSAAGCVRGPSRRSVSVSRRAVGTRCHLRAWARAGRWCPLRGWGRGASVRVPFLDGGYPWHGMNLTRGRRARSCRWGRGARNLQNGCALGRSAAVCGLLVTYRARRCTYAILSEGLSS